MTKSLAGYPEQQQRAIITRRLAQRERGAGYWAAVAAAHKLGIALPSAKPRVFTDQKEKRPPRKQFRKDIKNTPRIRKYATAG